MEDSLREKKYIKMTTEPIRPLIVKFAIPTVISMMITSIYNIVDAFFVGQIGTEGTAGVGLVFPLMTIIQAFGFFFGQGSGNYISRALGAKQDQDAEVMAATGNMSAFIFGLLILILGFTFTGPVLKMLGAESGVVAERTIQYAGDYYRIILIGAPFMCMSCVLNNQLRFQGNAVFSMVGLVSGAVINCMLDPLLIFTFDLEVTGAALATISSQIISCGILYIGTLRSDSLKIKIRNFKPSVKVYKNIIAGGAPSLFRQGLASVVTLFLNTAAGSAVTVANSDAAIAAFSIVGKIMMLGFSALLGFGQGFQPVCGFNYGAEEYGRVRRGYLFCIRVGTFALFVASVLSFVHAEHLIGIFRDDPKVIEYGSVALRCQASTFTLMGMVAMTNMLYQNIGRLIGGTLLAIARQGIMFLPAILILPKIIDPPIWGVYLAQPVADIFAFILAMVLGIRIYRELKQKENEKK